MNIAIIPARANSKRIKNKNITNFFGKPIIYWPIKMAKTPDSRPMPNHIKTDPEMSFAPEFVIFDIASDLNCFLP